MRATTQKKWRRINPYTCKKCGRRRLSFYFGRAKTKLCQKCRREIIDENQLKLFDESDTAKTQTANGRRSVV
jgi:predicted Zn-ribbon and HTH transcriptional regulator